jgi:hypothetical protein
MTECQLYDPPDPALINPEVLMDEEFAQTRPLGPCHGSVALA